MAIGERLYRVDAPGKVTGATLYPADIWAEEVLHGKVVFSGRPHARMVSMDLGAAEAVPGVVRIFTARDVPNNEYGLTIFDQPVLVGLGSPNPGSDISRWEGDQVAFVVAETAAAAAEAAERIEIEWEELPLVTDPVAAMNADTLVHAEREEGNIYAHYRIRKGDMQAGWAAADVVVEGEYVTPFQEHAYLQPEAGLAYMDGEGRVTVEVAGQWTHEDQEQICHALELPPEKVRVIYPAIGGAFGGREDMSIQIVLALAVWRLFEEGGVDRPIRVQWSREESIIGHHKRHPIRIRARWGATREGQITAVETEVILDAGAYNYTSNKVLGNAHLMSVGPYEVPNAHVDSYAVYTNNPPGGAFRGFGGPQGAFAAETQMNRLAEELGMDPVELRLKNCLREGSELITMTEMPPGVSLPQVIEQCARAAEWEAVHGAEEGRAPEDGAVPAPEQAAPIPPFKTLPVEQRAVYRGRGFACAFKNIGFSFGFPESCEATLELRGAAEIEEAVLYHAGAEVGQGAHSAFRQMTAEALGLPVERVSLILSDTAQTGNSGSASASRMTWMAGNAIRGAAELALEKWRNEDRPAVAHYRFTPAPTTTLDPETGKSMPNITYGYVAEVVDLSVDVETGHIHVESVVCASDVGKAINPQLIEGQIEGAVVQAHGYGLTENLQVRAGHILNPRLSTYLIPGIMDIPSRVQSVILEYPDPQGPWGARGMAEMPFIPYTPAVVAALREATGVWFHDFPLTPERVVAGLREVGSRTEEQPR
ncbi:MAG: xanthine dehydrogenase family protein molybdopterin-binding subunit [Candidatus Promineifilaceae bacterium]|nr:xanthine dehydrogenase family protein molybdopterin-binding subunit [Candidatus Promineifilaceae bacterium]